MKEHSREKGSKTPTEHSENGPLDFPGSTIALQFLRLFYPKLHSFLLEDGILDPSGHNMTFSSQAYCILVAIAAFRLETQIQ